MADRIESFKDTRTAILLIVVLLWSTVIFCRLVQKQVIEHDDYVKQAVRLQQGKRTLQAPRGVIYDRHLNELAVDVTLSTIIAEPRLVTDIPGTAKKLASILGMNPAGLATKMSNPARRNYLVVQRRIKDDEKLAIMASLLDWPPSEVIEGLQYQQLSPQEKKLRRTQALVADKSPKDPVTELKKNGFYFEDEPVRTYPSDELACHVLGFVNNNGDGGAGIELKYEKELKGRNGEYYFDRDAKGEEYRVNVTTPPVQGNSLVLTIDKSIQYTADRELAAGVKAAQARGGTAIVMEVETGRILALSNYPQFDGNRYNKYDREHWRNPAVTSPFEPGSTFKVAVTASAIEAGVARPNDLIDCQNGTITIGGHVFHDHNPYGAISVSRILEVSSNIGAAKLGLRLGQQRLYESLRKFGFGTKTGIDLPGEEAGMLRDWSKWSGLSIGAISFGQEVGVTSMQILSAINTIASGGVLVRPYVVERIIDAEGNSIPNDIRKQEPAERILRQETASAIKDALEGVILRGTAKRAALNGYRAAGKTGTAQKVEIIDPNAKIKRGRYSKSKYVASFIGFAPLPQPKITVLVQLDEPRNGYYGGSVSAPIFQKITQSALMQLKVPPDPSIQPLPQGQRQSIAANDARDFIPDATPLEPVTEITGNGFIKEAIERQRPGVVAVHVMSEVVVMPDFRGMSKRKVSDLCVDMGIQLQLAGAGLAVSQNPPPGTRIAKGEACAVTFAKSKAVAKKDVAAARASSRLTADGRF